MPKYEALSSEITEKIRSFRANEPRSPMAFDDKNVIRRSNIKKDSSTIWRPTFVHDIDKILHCPYYNRYTDKTQVFSLWKNDDITRRSLHVQLVSRIARTIGSALHLNIDLIEAIALGHDLGHTPFGHTGESYLNDIYKRHTGRHFIHNVHSVRVLDGIFPYNISLQVLNDIAAHNGEVECEEYIPRPMPSFEDFDRLIEKCYVDQRYLDELQPCTLEGAVVRLSDIIAYLGKDRQDAARTNLLPESMFINEDIGSINAEIINNLVVNVIENSYGKPYIKLDEKHFLALRKSKMDNYALIYNNAARGGAELDLMVKPMMEQIYDQMLDDFTHKRMYSPIFTHHIDYINLHSAHYDRERPYEMGDPDQIVVDYIASMTDNYLIDLYAYLFPNGELSVEYKGYFDGEDPYVRKDN